MILLKILAHKIMNFFRWFIVCYLILSVATGVFLFVKEVVPKTFTHFWSYKTFVAMTDWTIYAPELPESAHDMRYYFYEGNLADKNGFHAAFSEEDYVAMKQNRLEKYNLDFPGIYYYSGGEKEYLNREELKEMKVDYLDKLLPIEADDGQFYFLIEELSERTEVYHYEAVLCNDETCEMIELSCRICH